MNEELNGVGVRLLALRAKLKARDGKKEYKENCEAIREEIAKLELSTAQPVASPEEKDFDL